MAYCPRRTVLDKLLVDAAVEAGAEIGEGVSVEDVVIEDGRAVGITGRGPGGGSLTERARVIIGADGRRSRVAEAVRPEQYHERPPLLAGDYSYWSNLPMNGRFETYIRDHRGFAAAPTHEGLTLVVGGWPMSEFEANKKDVEGNFLKMLRMAPSFHGRIREAKRESPFVGTPVLNFFRKPYGPGWVLVGDAGYNKDFIAAQGISDAFRDAEQCATALDLALSGAQPFDEVMHHVQRTRHEHVMPMYEFTCQLATLEPPPPETLQLLGAVHGNRKAIDDFVRMNAGTISPAQFFAPENVGAIMCARVE